MSETPDFYGFPAEALRFLAELAKNNNREWFNAHKHEYRDHVLGPAQDFVLALGERLRTISAGIIYDTRTSGSGSILRIYRDIRFSKDKTPYHTHMRMVFWEGSRKKMENPGFFVSVEPTGATVYAGMYRFPQPFLAAYRNAVVDEELGSELEEALESVNSAGEYTIGREHYKRVPRGYDAEHRRAELLRYDALYGHSRKIPSQTILRPEFVEVCFEHCQNLVPLHRWLARVGDRFGL
jgi:uncharacterized protein (TIGR02453 family)